MRQAREGLLGKSWRFTLKALREDSVLRTSVLATILVITLGCIGMAAFSPGAGLPPPEKPPKTFSPRLFALLFLPAEFTIYGLILGVARKRADLPGMYLDWRLLRTFWEILKAAAASMLPLPVALLAMVAVAGGLQRGHGPSIATFVLALVLAVGAAFYIQLRCMFVVVAVARRTKRVFRTIMAESKGRVWRSIATLGPAYSVLAIASLAMEGCGLLLESRFGFVGLAPWFALDAVVCSLVGMTGAAVMAFGYQRVMGLDGPAETEPLGPAEGTGLAEGAGSAEGAGPARQA